MGGPARMRHLLALVAAGVVAVGAALALQAAGWLTPVQESLVDLAFRRRPPRPPTEVAVVAIDESTFGRLRQTWPFPRSLHAKAIARLTAAGARQIVYDVQFTEPTTPREDMALFEAARRSGRVVFATTEVDDQGGTNVLGGDENVAAARARVGAANFASDDGGAIRRLLPEVAGLPTLAVVSARSLGRAVPDGAFGGGGAWIDFRGPPGTVPTVSFADVLDGRVPDGLLRGRVVVVGASAPTLQDMHATPVATGRSMAGAEVQANAIWTALNGFPLRSGPGWVGLLGVIALGLAAPLAAARMPTTRAVAVALGAVAGWAVATWGAFLHGWIVPVIAPVLAGAIGLVGAVLASYWSEALAHRRADRLNALLEARVRERTEELERTQVEIIRRLGQAAESREESTGRHVERVGRLCEALAVASGMDERAAGALRLASALHDVGKIGVPDAVLLKPGRLDEAEWEVMRAHTTTGGRILEGSGSPLVRLAEEVAPTHHERWDGTGYPRGLKGEEIPLSGRICGICDVFDALVTARPYKEAWPLERAVEVMRSDSGRHFDPRLVGRFLEIAPALHTELGYRDPAP